jgi:hypothetical protein
VGLWVEVLFLASLRALRDGAGNGKGFYAPVRSIPCAPLLRQFTVGEA